MRVVFSDPQGTRTSRALPYVGPLAVLLVGVVGPLGAVNSVLTAVLAFGLLHLVAALPLRQRRPRPAELVAGPGFIAITEAGTRTQRIDARSIVGGTTARTRRGVLFTLAHAKRDQPITLEVDSDADAERVRHALGIGHGGFGAVGWRTSPSSAARAAFWGRIATFVIASIVAGIGFSGTNEAATAIGMLLGQFGLLGVIFSLAGLFGRPTPPGIEMTAAGLRMLTTQGWFTIPYDHVLGIEPLPDRLRVRVPPPYHAVEVLTADTLLTGEDRDALIKQILSASARARGLGSSREDVSGRIDALRRNGESPRAWLARLDLAGRMLGSAAGGYRGNTLDSEDLWAVLEDPDADAELRAAAARVLRHSPQPEARTRIDAAVAAVRDEATNARLRVAVDDDLENASRELETLEVEERVAPHLARR
jgi:hypothetical protein